MWSSRVSALDSVVAGSISCRGDDGIHCRWNIIRSKQLSSGSVYRAQCLRDLLIIVIRLIIYNTHLKNVCLFLSNCDNLFTEMFSMDSNHRPHVTLLARISLDPLSLPDSIVHRSWEVFHAIFCIGTELLYIGSRWSFNIARPYEGVYRSISLMSPSLLLQHSPACLIRLIRIIFEIVVGSRTATIL